jgi:hypothetical protein
MKIKVVVIDLELSRRAKRVLAWLLLGLTAIGVGAAANATALNTFSANQVLKADALNANFSALSTQIASISAPLTWNDLGLENAWVAYAKGYANPGYAKDALGIVHMRGLVTGSTMSGLDVAVLPSGFRPSQVLQAPVACGGTTPCTVVIRTTGEIVFNEIDTSTDWLSFESLTFEPGN